MPEDKYKEFKEYFEDDLNAIEEELKKSKEYSEIIDREIEELRKPLMSGKGSTRYLIDILEKAVSLQTQRQGLRRDRVAIKKAILDYASKQGADSGEENILLEKIEKLLKQDKEETPVLVQQNTQDLDSEIDKILNESSDV